ncbi:hypothetical protein YC2023_090609 [Brassica napus]
MANSFTLFADVKAWRCPNTFEVRLLHFLGGEEHVRKVSELMSLDMEHNHRQYIRVQCVMLTLRLKRDVNVRVSRLVLKATSGTHIYFDSETAAGKEEFDKLTGDGTDQTASSLKLVHAQKIEPLTVAGLSQ